MQLRVSFSIKVSVIADGKKYCLLVCDAVLFVSNLLISPPDCTSSTLEDRVIHHSRQYTIHFSCYVSSAQLSKSVTVTKPHRRCKGVLCGQQASITKSITRACFQFPPLPPLHTAFGFIFNKTNPLKNSLCFCTKPSRHESCSNDVDGYFCTAAYVLITVIQIWNTVIHQLQPTVSSSNARLLRDDNGLWYFVILHQL